MYLIYQGLFGFSIFSCINFDVFLKNFLLYMFSNLSSRSCSNHLAIVIMSIDALMVFHLSILIVLFYS